MENNRKKEIVYSLMTKKTNEIFFMSELAKNPSEESFIISSPKIFYRTSKKKIIAVYALCEQIRTLFTRYNYQNISLKDDAYEELRKIYCTKCLNKERMLNLFGTKRILSYDDFCKKESEYINDFNAYMDEKDKLNNTNFLYLKNQSKAVDLKSEIRQLLKNERTQEILYARAMGDTLDDVGAIFHITRERTRQIEITPRTLIERWGEKRHKQIIGAANSALISSKPLAKILGRQEAIIFIYACKRKADTKYSNWYYIKELDSLVYSKNNAFYTDLKETLTLHEGSTKEDILKKMSIKYPFFKEDTLDTFCKNSRFIIHNNRVWNIKVTIARALPIIAEEVYPDGIDITNDKQREELVSVMNQDYSLSDIKKGRTLTVRIESILVKTDKTVYVSPNKVREYEELNDEIRKSMQVITSDRIPYKKLYEQIKKETLEKANIRNYYGLNGYIKLYQNSLNIKATRHYAVKSKEDVSSREYFKELAEWLLKQGKPVSISDISDNTNWGHMQSKYAMIYFPEIVLWDFEVYFNVKCIKASEKTRTEINEVIKKAINNPYGYTSVHKLMPIFKKKFSGFLADNYITISSQLFHALRFLFGNEYAFSKPHILADRKINSFSTMLFLEMITDGKDIIKKSEIEEKIKEYYGERNSSIACSFHKFIQGYVRIDKDMYMKETNISYGPNEEKAINQYLCDHMEMGYFAVKNLDDFAGLPDMPFEWSKWAIKDMIKRYKTDYTFARKKSSNEYVTNIIVPKIKAPIYEEDIVTSIIKKHGKENAVEVLKHVGLSKYPMTDYKKIFEDVVCLEKSDPIIQK